MRAFQSSSSWLIILLSASILLTAGCMHKLNVNAHNIDKGQFVDPSVYTLEEYKSDKTKYNNALNSNPMDLTGAKIWRDSIVYGLASDVDLVYNKNYKKLFGNKNLITTAGDGITLGLGAAGSIATHAATKTIYAALDTAFSGLNLSISKNYYAEQSFQVIGVAMQTRRDKIRSSIYSQLSQDVTVYPLNAAKRDLVAYMQAGTLPAGLQELQEEAGTATGGAKTNTNTIPAMPTSVVANAGITQNALTWAPSTGASSYNIYYAIKSGVTVANGTKLGPLSANAYNHTGLDAASSYFYVVTALNSNGESTISAEVSAKPLAAGLAVPPGGSLSAPTNVTPQSVGSSVVVTWTVPIGAVTFNVYSASTTPVPTIAGSQLNPAALTNNSFTDTAPKPSAHYVIEAVDAGGAHRVPSSGAAVIASPPAPPRPVPTQSLH